MKIYIFDLDDCIIMHNNKFCLDFINYYLKINSQSIEFGPDYIIPKPVDPRVLFEVAPKVAEAAISSGVARHSLDLDSYRKTLETRLKKSQLANDLALKSL